MAMAVAGVGPGLWLGLWLGLGLGLGLWLGLGLGLGLGLVAGDWVVVGGVARAGTAVVAVARARGTAGTAAGVRL